ncbi:CLUMA_CG004436, isoform A [Clunio marinus]|uniref:CLUMA_CG004436, isoform A n=1 Tax=Clunio marinus TaxID=568069 RepID=A0A1J1HRQ9_9DIPT|nr:CLUMA_CG004436, isoform A [Clunio marinus]
MSLKTSSKSLLIRKRSFIKKINNSVNICTYSHDLMNAVGSYKRKLLVSQAQHFHKSPFEVDYVLI